MMMAPTSTTPERYHVVPVIGEGDDEHRMSVLRGTVGGDFGGMCWQAVLLRKPRPVGVPERRRVRMVPPCVASDRSSVAQERMAGVHLA